MNSGSISATPQETLAVLFLGLRLTWFLLVCEVNKFIAPTHCVKRYGYFQDLNIGAPIPDYMGSDQMLNAIAIIGCGCDPAGANVLQQRYQQQHAELSSIQRIENR